MGTPRSNKTVLHKQIRRSMLMKLFKAILPRRRLNYCPMEECPNMLDRSGLTVRIQRNQVKSNVNRPLPLGGPPGYVTIQTQFFFNKDLEYLRYGSKGSSPALSISMMIGLYYHTLDLTSKQLFPKHTITIAEKDFKNLYPSDFEDLNLLLLQGHLDHLPGSDKQMLSTAVKRYETKLRRLTAGNEDFPTCIESYQTQLNLTKLGWDAKGYEFKHDYTIIESPRAVVFPHWLTESRNSRSSDLIQRSDMTTDCLIERNDIVIPLKGQ
ncbi:hypothetical protein Tco_0566313 [Tanacetum coccineum]